MTQLTIWTPSKGDVPAIVATSWNLTATTDPGAANDLSQGYAVGSIWYNTSAGALRWWECLSAAAGAAVWVFSGAAYASGGSAPSSEVVQFGGGSAFAAAEGNINRQIFGTPVSPGTIGNDNVLAVYTLPAGSFDVAGRGLSVLAQGSFAATANNKRLKLIFNATTAVVGSAVTGGTTVCDTGVVVTSGLGWALDANVFKYGAAGSNTQIGLHQAAQVGGAVSALLAPSLITAVESGPILIAVTGNASTVVGDILLSFVEVNAMN